MFKVRLINRVLSHGTTQYPICGASLKNYGQAFLRPEFGGFVFEMSLEDYERDKFDLIGQTLFQQQWVPQFFIPEEPPTQSPEEATPTMFPFPDDSGGQLPESAAPGPVLTKSIKQRAKDAGVWKKGMTEDEMKAALGFPD